MDPSTITQLVLNVGVCGTIVLLNVWQSHKREDRLSSRIDTLEEFIKQELLSVISDQKSALERNTTAFEEFEDVLRKTHKEGL